MAEILCGDSYGQMHACSISTRRILHTYGDISASSHLSNLTFSPEDSPIFIAGHSSQRLYFYNLQEQTQSHIDIDTEQKLVGSDVSGHTIYSYSDGSIAVIPMEGSEVVQKEEIIFERDRMPRDTAAFRKGKLFAKESYAFVGFDVTPSVIDLCKQSLVWEGKNVTNDFLDLKVPIKDVDMVVADSSQLIVLHEDRKVRLYDIRKQQKKPTISKEFSFDKYKFKKLMISPCENYLYIGGGHGGVFKVDRRKDFHMVGKFSEAKGAITSLSLSPDNSRVVTGSLDGYLRIYNEESGKLQESLYVNQPIHSALFVDNIDMEQLQLTKANPVVSVKVPKRRNTVKLEYLKPRKLVKREEKVEEGAAKLEQEY